MKTMSNMGLFRVPFMFRADYPGHMPDLPPHRRTRARGTDANPETRFDAHEREAVDDGWAPDPDVPLARTEARKARASNETLYNWYGDKQGLFKALVTRNAAEVKLLLEEELAAEVEPMATLARFGPKLLELLLGDRAIALNRAAAADPTGELGAVISKAGRETVLPLLVEVLGQAKRRGDLTFDEPEETASLYMNLLVGDLQIRRVIGRVPAQSPNFCEERSAVALRRLSRLLALEP